MGLFFVPLLVTSVMILCLIHMVFVSHGFQNFVITLITLGNIVWNPFKVWDLKTNHATVETLAFQFLKPLPSNFQGIWSVVKSNRAPAIKLIKVIKKMSKTCWVAMIESLDCKGIYLVLHFKILGLWYSCW